MQMLRMGIQVFRNAKQRGGHRLELIGREGSRRGRQRCIDRQGMRYDVAIQPSTTTTRIIHALSHNTRDLLLIVLHHTAPVPDHHLPDARRLVQFHRGHHPLPSQKLRHLPRLLRARRDIRKMLVGEDEPFVVTVSLRPIQYEFAVRCQLGIEHAIPPRNPLGHGRLAAPLHPRPSLLLLLLRIGGGVKLGRKVPPRRVQLVEQAR
mmetsp:Transcript_2384/g.5883  ORF Transcript_2384/g.5883 Transcript_2384/m.5883 type:complete len:206 (-) Transcript_2384:22-639(-)